MDSRGIGYIRVSLNSGLVIGIMKKLCIYIVLHKPV